jgi:hypothetical protein
LRLIIPIRALAFCSSLEAWENEVFLWLSDLGEITEPSRRRGFMLKLELLKFPKGLLNMLDFISILGDTEIMGYAINLSKEPA